MEKKKQIGEHIVDHLSERMNEEIVDPVLDEWLAEDESNQEDFKRYKEIWKETGSYLEQETFNAQYAWDKIDRINKKRYNKRKRLVNIGYIISGVAATLLLVLGFSKMGVFDKQPEMLVRMTADYGSRSEVVLPDGSVVKLNSGSDITYSYNAKEKIREVNFQGEGFFDVSKNKIPFVIKMNNGLRLKVHGTSFNLQAYTLYLMNHVFISQEITNQPSHFISVFQQKHSFFPLFTCYCQDRRFKDNRQPTTTLIIIITKNGMNTFQS